jgi:MFS family permease
MLQSILRNREAFQVFQYLNFRRFIFSKFLFSLALQIQFVVLSWHVYEITKDPLSLGLIGLAEAIPAVSLAMYGGHVADRNDRRKIMAFVQFCMLICSIVLLGVTLHFNNLPPEQQSAIPFYVIMFFIGVIRAFYSPAQLPLMTQLIPRSAYANSSAWSSTVWHIAVVVGSSAGGLMLGFLGKTFTYSAVIFLIMAAFIQMIRIPRQPIQVSVLNEGVHKSIREGIRFVFKNQAIVGALLLDLIAVLFGGAMAMLPIFASDILMVGEKGYGFLRAAPFAGSVVMALYMTRYPPLKNSGRKLMICVSGFAVCMIVFALSKSFFLSLFILALSGGFDNVSVVIRSTIIQLLTPDEMRGRVSAVSTMFISSSNEIGAFESGFAAKLMGLIPSVIFGGGVALLAVGGTALWMPGLRNLSLDELTRDGKETST